MVQIKHNPVFLILLFILACEEKKPDPLPINCYLKPEVGPCDAAIPRYYYDQDEGECKEFTWGGCEGVVPFETMADCKSACGE